MEETSLPVDYMSVYGTDHFEGEDHELCNGISLVLA